MRRRDRIVLTARVAYHLDSVARPLQEFIQDCPDCMPYPQWPYYLLCIAHSVMAQRIA